MTAIVAIGILALFYRDNILAYVGAGFLLTTLNPMVSLLGLAPKFFVGNGIVLAFAILAVVGWMITGRQEVSAAIPAAVEGSGPVTPDNPSTGGFTSTQ